MRIRGGGVLTLMLALALVLEGGASEPEGRRDRNEKLTASGFRTTYQTSSHNDWDTSLMSSLDHTRFLDFFNSSDKLNQLRIYSKRYLADLSSANAIPITSEPEENVQKTSKFLGEYNTESENFSERNSGLRTVNSESDDPTESRAGLYERYGSEETSLITHRSSTGSVNRAVIEEMEIKRLANCSARVKQAGKKNRALKLVSSAMTEALDAKLNNKLRNLLRNQTSSSYIPLVNITKTRKRSYYNSNTEHLSSSSEYRARRRAVQTNHCNNSSDENCRVNSSNSLENRLSKLSSITLGRVQEASSASNISMRINVMRNKSKREITTSQTKNNFIDFTNSKVNSINESAAISEGQWVNNNGDQITGSEDTNQILSRWRVDGAHAGRGRRNVREGRGEDGRKEESPGNKHKTNSPSKQKCLMKGYIDALISDLSFQLLYDSAELKKPDVKKRRRQRVESSSNVFVEDLQSLKSLETTAYITDTTQASDFEWKRDSGLLINVGILNVNLIPEYRSVQHNSDNNYMLNFPSESLEKQQFQKVLESFCSHPIPDYYTLTLEVTQNRTTAASMTTCNQHDRSASPCPAGVRNGEKYLHRHLNVPCPLTEGLTEVLNPAVNSIVCTDSTEMLTKIFKQREEVAKEIRDVPKFCRDSRAACMQCLKRQDVSMAESCLLQEMLEKRCCSSAVDCYNKGECRTAHSHQCITSPVQCATGNVYRYSLFPFFENIGRGFKCHVTREAPPILYQLFYRIEVPSLNYKTPPVYKTVTLTSAHASSRSFHRSGQFKLQYIDVEHSSGLEIPDEYILAAITDAQLSEKQTFFVSSINKAFTHSVPQPSAESKQESQGHRLVKPSIDLPSHVHSIKVQFSRPFDYSTSTWVDNNNCDKNITNIRQMAESPDDDVTDKNERQDKKSKNSEHWEEVTVRLQNTGPEQFRYFIKSHTNPPYIRFKIPGDRSILSHYFSHDSGGSGQLEVTDSSPTARLSTLYAGRVWSIDVSGQLSGCPGYIGLKVIERFDLEELFNLDLLVTCPQQFNLSLRIPTGGIRSDISKTFDVLFYNHRGVVIHQISLTEFRDDNCDINMDDVNMKQGEERMTQTGEKSSVLRSIVQEFNSLLSRAESPYNTSSQVHTSPGSRLPACHPTVRLGDELRGEGRVEAGGVNPVVLLVVVGLMINVLALCLCSFLHMERSVSKTKRKTSANSSSAASSAAVTSKPSPMTSPADITRKRHTTHRHRMLVILLYVTVRLIYSLALSFTALCVTFTLLVQIDLKHLASFLLLSSHPNPNPNPSPQPGHEPLLQYLSAGEQSYKSLEKIKTQLENSFLESVQREREELIMSQSVSTFNRQACSLYIGQQLRLATVQLNDSVTYLRSNIYSFNSSLTHTVNDRLNHMTSRLSHDVIDYVTRLRTRMTEAFTELTADLKRLLDEIFKSNWFLLARDVFNRSRAQSLEEEDEMWLLLPEHNQLKGLPINFAEFIGIKEVSELQLWLTRFWDRYYMLQPDISRFNISHQFPSSLSEVLERECSTFSNYVDRSVNRKYHVKMDSDKYDSFRFMVSLPASNEKLSEPSLHYNYDASLPLISLQADLSQELNQTSLDHPELQDDLSTSRGEVSTNNKEYLPPKTIFDHSKRSVRREFSHRLIRATNSDERVTRDLQDKFIPSNNDITLEMRSGLINNKNSKSEYDVNYTTHHNKSFLRNIYNKKSPSRFSNTNLNADTMWVLCLVLDLLLFIQRVTLTYLYATFMYRQGTEPANLLQHERVLIPCTLQYQNLTNGGNHISKPALVSSKIINHQEKCEQCELECPMCNLSSEQRGVDQTTPCHSCSSTASDTEIPSPVQTTLKSPRGSLARAHTSISVIRRGICLVLHSTILPFSLISLVVVLHLALAHKACSLLLESQVLLLVHHSTTRQDLICDQHQHFINSEFSSYEDHMRSELKQLKALNIYIEKERQRLRDSFVEESCSLWSDSGSSWSCSRRKDSRHIHAQPSEESVTQTSRYFSNQHPLPCNQVPYLMKPLFTSDAEENVVYKSLREHILSACRLLLTTFYSSMFVSFIVITSHVLGHTYIHRVSLSFARLSSRSAVQRPSNRWSAQCLRASRKHSEVLDKWSRQGSGQGWKTSSLPPPRSCRSVDQLDTYPHTTLPASSSLRISETNKSNGSKIRTSDKKDNYVVRGINHVAPSIIIDPKYSETIV